jgi:hypothetical protein
MITAREASEMLEKMTPQERFKAMKGKVSESTRNALDKVVREAVASFRDKVDVTLGANVCRDSDENLRNFLMALGYKDIKVSSDFPC